MKFSALMNYLMGRMNAVNLQNGKSSPALEDFMPILLSVLVCYEPPMRLVPGGLRGVLGVRDELDVLLEKAKSKNLNFDTAQEEFIKFDSEHADTRSIRENAFSVTLQYAAAVSDENDETVTAVAVWDYMISHPTLSVKKIILGMGDDQQEVPFDLEDFWSNVFSSEGGGKDDTTSTIIDIFENEDTSDEDDNDESSDESGNWDWSGLDSFDIPDDKKGKGGKTDISWDDFFGDGDKKDTDDGKGKKPKLPGNISEIVVEVKGVRDALLEKVRGQNAAIDTFISSYFRAELTSLLSTKRKKPRATFLFAGPPGVGKTFLAESAADLLGLPYRRFDMSEYADKEANLAFCGSDKVYKNGQPGNVTNFVAEHPRSILLFDEIEKAHINVIYLFLQMLDAGRLRDNFTNEEVSFTDTIVILTTNAGRNLYDDPAVVNLSALPRRQIIEALRNDKSERGNGLEVFPSALCSRFAAGNVVMFDRLEAHDLCKIAASELGENITAFSKYSGISVDLDPDIGTAILLAEGARSDARTISARSGSFFYDEIYELFRLVGTGKGTKPLEGLKSIKVRVELPEDDKVKSLFVNSETPGVLVFGDEELINKCKEELPFLNVFGAGDVNDASEILFANDITIALCDVTYGVRADHKNYVSIEDSSSVGMDFLRLMCGEYDTPLFILARHDGDVNHEEMLSFSRCGVRGKIGMDGKGGSFADKVKQRCDAAYQQKSLNELARASKVLTYKTAQIVSEDGVSAEIVLSDLSLAFAPGTDDSKSLLVTKPDVKFPDVIGAEDAKSELKYFVEYLKSPIKYIRKGLRAPKGILLYGPPGTGKTMLAKAMAGESEVTFIAAEGNRFLQRYVGEGPSSVHELFSTARKYAPSILFIDEIDAIGKDRSGDDAKHSSDVLTAFLTEMDGFNTDTTRPVFVLAATNFDVGEGSARSLDPALLRRFDRKLLVDLPTKSERERYIRMKMKKNPALTLCDEQIDNISTRSTGMSLAEIESVIELALRNAVRSENLVVDDAAMEEAFETFMSGEEKKWSADSLIRTARHEAGHTLICWLSGEKPSYVTIVARGNHGGYMQHGDEEDKPLYTKRDLLSKIRTSLAGRAAEVVYYGEEDGISTGPSSDLASATAMAERMVCAVGMDDEFGLAVINRDNMPGYYSEVHKRVNHILSREYEEAKRIVSENRKAIDALCDALMAKNHLRAQEIDAILKENAVV